MTEKLLVPVPKWCPHTSTKQPEYTEPSWGSGIRIWDTSIILSPLSEFPDQEWGSYDKAEHPDQGLLCPDYPEYPGELYPGDGSLEVSGYEY